MDTFKLGFNFHGLPSTHTYASIIHPFNRAYWRPRGVRVMFVT